MLNFVRREWKKLYWIEITIMDKCTTWIHIELDQNTILGKPVYISWGLLCDVSCLSTSCQLSQGLDGWNPGFFEAASVVHKGVLGKVYLIHTQSCSVMSVYRTYDFEYVCWVKCVIRSDNMAVLLLRCWRLMHHLPAQLMMYGKDFHITDHLCGISTGLQ